MNTVSTNPVGRPRSFDESVVLGSAMEVFWRKGYESTSLADLMEATGLHKGSLYQAFGDKHSLFIRSLTEFIAQLASTMANCLTSADSGLEGLRNALYYHIDMGINPDGTSNGCFALNSLVESGQDDPEVLNILEHAYQMREKLITETVARAQAEGGLGKTMPAGRIATLIATFEAGLMVELKGPMTAEEAKSQVDDFLASLG
jgi:TetR/AcrR family transcriptional repressor of nem operon